MDLNTNGLAAARYAAATYADWEDPIESAIRAYVSASSAPPVDAVGVDLDRVTAALVALARHNIPTDVQELLMQGDPMRDIAPGALEAALPPKIAPPKRVSNDDRFYGDPVVRFRAMAEATYPSEAIDGAHFRMWCAIAANEIETARAALTVGTGEEKPVAVAKYPLATFGHHDVMPLGLYRVHWASGGSSLAAVGMMKNGDRWIAPTNWTSPCCDPTNEFAWGGIDRVEQIPTPVEPSVQKPVAWQVTATDILREWFGGERYARDYEYLDANHGKQAERVAAYLASLSSPSPAGDRSVKALEVKLAEVEREHAAARQNFITMQQGANTLLRKLDEAKKALEPFGRNAGASSLAKVYAHLTRQDAQTARALSTEGASDHG